ncbi:Sodium/hydrogen exchanger family-domain-containing protein [Limtongia smithiae]|uniref:Sodium/hydrogen exchanger family-domain-containing protein n=1 Tax=Limtongia smithiae TaxID=1125753 RepID=UPI0034CEDA48
MAWVQLWIDKPHLAYAIIGGFTTIFSLISLFVKEKLYIGEATVATVIGLIFGPHAANLFDPSTWGNVDFITLEISRIVLIVQIFAVAVELPKKYMLRHWLSVFYLLVPTMAFGWLISSAFIWKLVPSLRWVEALVISGCITATDPVLASAVVGKGKFSKRVPGHLRNILSAESGCNDGMAFPFTYLGLYLIQYEGHGGTIIQKWVTLTILYSCVFGCILGALIGYCGRHAIKFAESHNLIDRESFLVFYFVLALFCTGVGSILGTDDLLVSFSAGAAFAWDGWFTKQTEESHVSNVIDLLLNLAYFVYFGAIIPWEQYNNPDLGLSPWKLSIIAILLILFRRIPIMLILKPLVPDIRTWREALFCGHFGPIGVGAVFMCILARAELEHDEPTPLAELPVAGSKNYVVVAVIWPVVSFMIIASIIVHGSSIAVFTLGKRLNTMAITMSYTTGNGNGPTWLQRLPRMESGQSMSFRKVETLQNEPLNRLLRRRPTLTDEEEPSRPRARAAGRMSRPKKKARKAQQEAQRQSEVEDTTQPSNSTLNGMPASYEEGARFAGPVTHRPGEVTTEEIENPTDHEVYQEGNKLIVENSQGEVLATIDSNNSTPAPWTEDEYDSNTSPRQPLAAAIRNRTEQRQAERKDFLDVDSAAHSPSSDEHHTGDRTRAIAYQLDDEIIVESEEGEVIRRYRINRHPRPGAANESGLDRALSWVGLRRGSQLPSSAQSQAPGSSPLAHSSDLEMQRISSSGQVTSTSSGSGVEKAELPRNFLQRMSTDEDIRPSKPIPRMADEEEETPAERKRRLAALQGSTSSDRYDHHERDEDVNSGDEEEEDNEDDDDEDDDDDTDQAPSRVSFAGESDVERRRRISTRLQQQQEQHQQEREDPGSSLSESSSGDTPPTTSQSEAPRGITWGAVKRSNN